MENTNTENASGASSDVHSSFARNLFHRLLSYVIQFFQSCLPIIQTVENVSTSTPNDNGKTSYRDYDVFINHRGPDVKATFATYLYRRLRECGLKVFLDEPEMQVGDVITGQIKQAIETASIHIAVFSPTYAESSWCLNELEHMWRIHQSRHTTIIPVFYKVDPSEVRLTDRVPTGNYVKALEEKKKRFNFLTIQKWREALKSVAFLSGLELKKWNDDEEFASEVVRHVLERYEKRRLKYVTNDEFGRTVQNCNTKFVGIVGPAGVGKTTLANEFFESNKSGYSASCFLSDVKQNTTNGSLISMQRKLIKDLTPPNQPMGTIGTIDEGRDKLKMLISSSKVLIILDDVNHPDQLDAVLPMQDVIGSMSSLILVTSRDKNVFERRIMEVYNLTGLNTVHPRTNLILAGRWLEQLPVWLGQLTSLTELWLRDSPNLKCLSGSSFQLRYQSASYQLLNRLEKLTIMDCGIQTLFLDLLNMKNLTDLRVYDCPLRELFFRKVPERVILGRESRTGSTHLKMSSQDVFANLQRLWINSCKDLVKVGSLPTTLIRLDLSYCKRLRQIEGLCYLARLEKLDISGCEELEELEPLGKLKSLKELKAFRCSNLKRIQGLAGTKLQIIYIGECDEIKEMPDVERLLSLKKLDVCGCLKLQWGVGVFAQLQRQLNDGFLHDSN